MVCVVAVVLAGCAGVSPSPANDSDPSHDQGASTGTALEDTISVGHVIAARQDARAAVSVAGVAAFGFLDAGLAALLGEESASAAEGIRTRLGTAYQVGFLLDEGALASAGEDGVPALGFLRGGAAVLAVAAEERLGDVAYVAVSGWSIELHAYLERSPPPPGAGVALVVAESVTVVPPRDVDLRSLADDLDVVLGGDRAVVVRTRAVLWGTTRAVDEPAAPGLSVGTYVAGQGYARGDGSLRLVRAPMAMLWLGNGQEHLGRSVVLEAVLVPEAGLRDEAKAHLGSAWEQLVAARLAAPDSVAAVAAPWLSPCPDCRVQAYLIGLNVVPADAATVDDLASLSSRSPDAAGALGVAVRLASDRVGEFRLVGTGMKTVCGPGCSELPYDLGVYWLASVGASAGPDPSVSVDFVPVVGIFAWSAPTHLGGRVEIQATYWGAEPSQAGQADALSAALVHMGGGAANLRDLESLADVDSLSLRRIPGLVWANEIRTLPPSTDALPVVLLPPPPSSWQGGTVALRWFWPAHADAGTVRYELHHGESRMTAQWLGASSDSCFVGPVDGYSPRFFRVFAPTGAPSNAIRLDETVSGSSQASPCSSPASSSPPPPFSSSPPPASSTPIPPSSPPPPSPSPSPSASPTPASSPSPSPPPSPTLYSVTRCSYDPKHCLRVYWSDYAEPGFVRYEVYRSVAAGPWSLLWNVGSPSDNDRPDEGLTCGTAYSYYVRVHSSGGSSNSNTLGDTPRGPAGGC